MTVHTPRYKLIKIKVKIIFLEIKSILQCISTLPGRLTMHLLMANYCVGVKFKKEEKRR